MSSRTRMLLPHEIEEMERQQDMQERGRRLMDYHRRRLTIPEFIDWTPPLTGGVSLSEQGQHGLP